MGCLFNLRPAVQQFAGAIEPAGHRQFAANVGDRIFEAVGIPAANAETSLSPLPVLIDLIFLTADRQELAVTLLEGFVERGELIAVQPKVSRLDQISEVRNIWARLLSSAGQFVNY